MPAPLAQFGKFLLLVGAALTAAILFACSSGDESSVLFEDFTAADGCRSAVSLVVENAQDDLSDAETTVALTALPESDCEDPQDGWRYRKAEDGTYEFVVSVRCEGPTHHCARTRIFEDDRITTCKVTLDPFLGSVSFRKIDCF